MEWHRKSKVACVWQYTQALANVLLHLSANNLAILGTPQAGHLGIPLRVHLPLLHVRSREDPLLMC